MNIVYFDQSLKNFLDLDIERSTKSKVARAFDLLEIYTYKLGMPHSKELDNNLYELRIKGKQESRIFYCFNKNEIVLLHAFIKKSQKIPYKEIETAISRIKFLTNT